MPDVNITINAEGAKAINSLVKMANAQVKVENATKGAGRAAGKQARQTFDASASMRKFISSAGGVLGVTASFAALGIAIRTVDTNLKAVGKKQLDAAAQFLSLAIINPGQVQQAFAAAKGLAADIGVDPAVAARTLQTVQSKTTGDDPAKVLVEATRRTRTALLLQKLLADEESAKNIVVFGGGLGNTAIQSGNAFQIAAERSALNLTEVAKGAEALPSFDDLTFAAASISALTSAFTSEQLATAARNLATTLNVPNKLTKDLGFDKDTTEIQRLERIAESLDGDFSLAGIQAAGLTGKRPIRSLSTALKELEHIKGTMALIEAAPPTLLQDTLDRARKDSPLLATEALKAKASAQFKVGQLFGPGSQLAMAQNLQRSNVGLQEMAAGRANLTVDPETGEATLMRRLGGGLLNRLALFGFQAGSGLEGPGPAPIGSLSPAQEIRQRMALDFQRETDREFAAESLEKTLAETRDALVGNTEAMRQNTEAVAATNGGAVTSPFTGANGDIE